MHEADVATDEFRKRGLIASGDPGLEQFGVFHVRFVSPGNPRSPAKGTGRVIDHRHWQANEGRANHRLSSDGAAAFEREFFEAEQRFVRGFL